MATQAATLDALAACVGAGGLLTDPADVAPYLSDWTGRWPGQALAVARPRSTEDVAALVRTAAAHGIGIVPQGGNTGLVGGAAAPRGALLLALGRMNRVRHIDVASGVLVAEAGCVLAGLQADAAERGFALPLGLGAEGSATIGGIVSTNAGGIRALRYGVARDLVLGLEVVLADGRVWDGLRTTRKDNMGYDLKQLFIGAEGTLGVVTAIALRLTMAWRQVETAFLAVADPAAALALLDRLRADTGDAVVACELIPALGLDLAETVLAPTPRPVARGHAWHLLVEFATSAADGLRAAVEQRLFQALHTGLALDGALADNARQRAAFWRWREAVVEGQQRAGPAVRFDVAVPIGAVARFIAEADAAVAARAPHSRPLAFGHIGDGNIHYTVLAPDVDAGMIRVVVHDLVLRLGGSLCAEHGVGRSMVETVAGATSGVGRDLMRAIKGALDPDGRMNPGAVL